MLGRFDEKIPGVILIALMDDLQKFLNITNGMTGEQMGKTADLILNDYRCRNLKPEDYKVIFSGIKKGEYGKAFNRLDGQELFIAINAYIQNRDVWVEENSYREHNQIKAQEKNNLISPEMKEFYRELVKKVEIPEVKEPERVETTKPVREKSPRDILIQKLFSEFNEKTKYQIGKPYLELDGKMLDQVEWVEKMLARALEQNKD